MVDVAVIDYGVGNLLSVSRAFEHCGATVTVTGDPETILAASHVVLPGVGAFASAMEALSRDGLDDVAREVARRGTPLLGVCLGMQMLLDESEEFGLTRGLGLIAGRVVPVEARDSEGSPLKIPHIGWSELAPAGTLSGWQRTILEELSAGDAVYFVHSFMAAPADPAHRLADCRYGGRLISAVIARENVAGCQFHPEKSGAVGLRLLRSFMRQPSDG